MGSGMSGDTRARSDTSCASPGSRARSTMVPRLLYGVSVAHNALAINSAPLLTSSSRWRISLSQAEGADVGGPCVSPCFLESQSCRDQVRLDIR